MEISSGSSPIKKIEDQVVSPKKQKKSQSHVNVPNISKVGGEALSKVSNLKKRPNLRQGGVRQNKAVSKEPTTTNRSYGSSEESPTSNRSYGSSEESESSNQSPTSNRSYGSSEEITTSNSSYGSADSLSVDVVPIDSSLLRTAPSSNFNISEGDIADIKKNVKDVKLLLEGKDAVLQFTDLTEGLRAAVTKQKYLSVVDHITANAHPYFDEIANSKTSLIVKTDSDEQLLIKNSGKVYLKLSTLGKGSFKTTDKYILIASTISDHVKQKEGIFRSFSSPTPGAVAPTPIEAEENKKEIALNQFIKKNSKSHHMDHVSFAKSISSIGNEGEGLMAEVFDADVNNKIKNNPLSPEEAYDICYQMTEGVRELHDIGVVHRDIKPDNFLIRNRGGKNEVKIADFGKSAGPNELKLETIEFFKLISDPLWAPLKDPTNDAFFSTHSDIYQLGICLCLTLGNTSLESFFKSASSDMVALKARRNITKWKNNPEKWTILKKIKDAETKSFLLRMVDPNDPAQRPTIQEVSEFFNNKAKLRP